MTAIAQGTVRSIVCNAKLKIDVVPVDFVVNTMICASWSNFVQRTKRIKVYNCTSSTLHPITWNEFGYLIKKYSTEFPSKHVMWYPGFTFRTNKFIHAIVRATLHFLPAFILDLISRARSHKSIMLKLTKRIDLSAQTGEFFSTHEWIWRVDNMIALMEFASTHESCRNFEVNIQNMDWDMYLQRYILGIRKYILKENLDTLPYARSRLKKLYLVLQCAKILGFVALFESLKYLCRTIVWKT
ncbi:putative fatty acyl-CoA reductase CG5065 [Solenopsis invicta]|nr:putative fatty acyl-CoA reductase CG5065 [Solenopsis invicta]